MKKLRIGLFTAGLAGMLLLTACSVDRRSVFHAVITDKEEIDSNLENDLSVVGMADDGIYYYVAAAGAIWRRPVSDNTSASSVEWESVKMPADARLCTAFLGHSGSLYAGFMLTDSTFALFSGAYAVDPSWSKATDTEIADKQVTALFSLNSGADLFATVKESGGYTLYYSADGSDFQGTGITSVTYPVNSMVWDGSNYWTVSKNTISRAPAFGGLGAAFSPVPELAEGEGFSSLYYSQSKGKYFLSLDNGLVYSATDPTASWPEQCSRKITSTEKNIYFTSMAEIESNLMVGTLNNGFYQTKGGGISALEVHEDELVSDINTSSVLGFYVDVSENTVFFLTIGYGLYRNTYSDAEGWGSLIRE